MSTQNQYEPQTITCDGGLDLVTPKLLTAPGSLTDVLNFEVGTRIGYSRVDGYDRFDGKTSPSLAYDHLVCLALTGDLTAYDAGDTVYDVDGTIKIGQVTSVIDGDPLTYDFVFVAVTNYDKFRSLIEASQVTINSTQYTLQLDPMSGLMGYKRAMGLTTFDVVDQADFLNDEYVNLRNEIGPVPGGNWYLGVIDQIAPPIGLHLFKDTTYAIQNMNQFYFTGGNEEFFAGDIVEDGSGNQLTVREVHVTSGTFAGSDAAGSFIAFGNTFVAGAVDIVRPTATITGAFTYTTLPSSASVEEAWQAGIWSSSSTGWAEVETGWIFDFDTGTNQPNILNRGQVTQTNLLHGDTGNIEPGAISNDSSWTVSPWHSSTSATKLEAVLDYEDPATTHTDTYNAYLSKTSFGNDSSDYITVSSFAGISDIPSDATIVGVEVGVVAAGTQSGVDQSGFYAQDWKVTVQPSATNAELKTSDTISQGQNYLTFGSSTDTWGIGSDPASLSGLSLDVRFIKGNTVVGDGATPVIGFDQVVIKVYFTQEVEEYYFWNGSDDVKAQVIDFYLTDQETSWDTDDATGRMQVYTITPVGSSNRRTILDGDEIRSSPAGGGILVAKVTSDMVFAGLSPLKDLEENSSRYQMITANFYGQKDWEAIYGANGAGRAFAYDGFYLRYISTGLSDDLDKPRHVAFHQHCLVLGFDSGNFSLSVAGEPTNYSGVDGAVSFDVGDGVTGLVRMNGTTLGVFCEKSIHGLVGSNPNDFSTMVLVPYEGAIEYTVVDMGRPVYCSPRGISVFEQSSAYGDFLGNRLSTLMTPWLLPRIQKQTPKIPADGTFVNSPSLNPVVAIAVRSKNQYRLWFEDGYILTMTLVGLELKPQFTFQRLSGFTRDTSDFFKYLVPRAEFSGNDSDGLEHIFISNSYDTSLSNFSDNLGYVFELDRGWTFDSFAIWGYVDINDNFFGSPFVIDQVRKERVYGLSHGLFPLRTLINSDYGNLVLTPATAAATAPVPLPREDLYPIWIKSEPEPVTNICNTAKEGRSFSIKYYIPPVGDVMTAVQAVQVAPPGVIQALLIQHSQTKGDV